MARILVLFSTYDGQTGRIATHVAGKLVRLGHQATACPADAADARERVERSEAVIVGSAVRFGKHRKRLERFLKRNARALDARPNAFFSVCLSIAGPRPRPDLVAKANARLFERGGWRPQQSCDFAGALPYRRFNPLLRLVMRFIVGLAGGDTDTSRNYEYTDWNAVERFASDFAARIPSPRETSASRAAA